VETIGETEAGFEAIESQLAAEDADLDEREHLVLRLRFGRNMSQSEIGKELGVSQMQISRIMRRGLRKLLEAVGDDEPSAAEAPE
jgi:RNA polymerase sigma-B factor